MINGHYDYSSKNVIFHIINSTPVIHRIETSSEGGRGGGASDTTSR